MSVRRRSCDPCYKLRKKCDLAFPICERCHGSGKECHYKYPPQLPVHNDTAKMAMVQSTGVPNSFGFSSDPGWPWHQYRWHNSPSQLQLDHNVNRSLRAPRPIPKSLGILGDMESPVTGPPRPWSWAFNQLRNYPLSFAGQGETMFIHKNLHQSAFPHSLRVAFGICAAYASMTDGNRHVLFQALDAEVTDLLAPALASTLLDDLARLQSAVLYQIIRLSYGGLEQRIVAERQEFLVRSRGLSLLQRADAELAKVQRTWETWLVAESVRRTVLVVFKLYSTYADFKYGKCTEKGAMALLPVSNKAKSWGRRVTSRQCWDEEETLTYGDFQTRLAVAPPRELEPFEELLAFGCTGPVRVTSA